MYIPMITYPEQPNVFIPKGQRGIADSAAIGFDMQPLDAISGQWFVLMGFRDHGVSFAEDHPTVVGARMVNGELTRPIGITISMPEGEWVVGMFIALINGMIQHPDQCGMFRCRFWFDLDGNRRAEFETRLVDWQTALAESEGR